MTEYTQEILEDIETYADEHDWDFEDSNIRYKMEDDLMVDDAITGNGSGSYYFNSNEAKETVKARLEEVAEAFVNFEDDLQQRIINEDWEAIDVITRCYYLSDAIEEFLENK